MALPLKGMVHGNTVTLDAPVPLLEGKRVLVLLEATEEASALAQQQTNAWDQWVATGPQGPLEDVGEPDFP